MADLPPKTLMPKEKITLKEAAKLANVSPSLIYHYIKKGLLRKPDHIPNPKGRGILAVYPPNIVDTILQIKDKLKTVHSLSQIGKEFSINKEEFVIKRLEELLALAKKKNPSDPRFKEGLQSLTGFVASPSLSSTCYTGEKFK